MQNTSKRWGRSSESTPVHLAEWFHVTDVLVRLFYSDPSYPVISKTRLYARATVKYVSADLI